MNRGTLIMSRGAIENTMTTMRRDDTRGSTTRVSYPRVVSRLWLANFPPPWTVE